MKIPKYIEKALDDRVKAVDKFNTTDLVISNFIDKYEIDVDTEDFHGGVESIVNPDASADRIREAIKNKEN